MRVCDISEAAHCSGRCVIAFSDGRACICRSTLFVVLCRKVSATWTGLVALSCMYVS